MAYGAGRLIVWFGPLTLSVESLICPATYPFAHGAAKVLEEPNPTDASMNSNGCF